MARVRSSKKPSCRRWPCATCTNPPWDNAGRATWACAKRGGRSSFSRTTTCGRRPTGSPRCAPRSGAAKPTRWPAGCASRRNWSGPGSTRDCFAPGSPARISSTRATRARWSAQTWRFPGACSRRWSGSTWRSARERWGSRTTPCLRTSSCGRATVCSPDSTWRSNTISTGRGWTAAACCSSRGAPAGRWPTCGTTGNTGACVGRFCAGSERCCGSAGGG